MARAYTVATTAITIGTTAKWVDNVLSHNRVPGVLQSRQGLARRLTFDAITILEIMVRLSRELALPTRRSLDLASRIAGSGKPESRLEIAPGFVLVVDTATVKADLMLRLADAVEITPTPRRGRPRAR